MSSSLFRVLVAGTVTMVMPVTAFAQTPEPQTAPPPTTPATPATAAEPPPVTPATPAEPPPPPDGHFRWGLSPMFGTFFPGPTTVALGFEGRFGYAFNERFTVFGSAGAVGGVGFGAEVNDKGGSGSVSAISYWYFGANADALLAGPLFVGAGAGIGKGGWGVVKESASANGAGQEVISAGGVMPSVDGRIGIATGTVNRQTGKRSGFMIALDLRVLIAPNAATTKQEAGPSGALQSVTVSESALGFSPMLHIGFESR